MEELDQYLRNEIKYNEQLPSEVEEAYEKLRDKIREILSDSNLTME
jgi:flagellar basal body-associated protein FliL